MIYITGDTHSEFNRLNARAFSDRKNMTKDDYVIICGDFGGIWDQTPSGSEKYWLKWLDAKPFTTLFIDGNHENFDRLNAYPVTQWHGGRVHKITDSVIHLMRGEIYNINGKSVFTFGGAQSHDIRDGVLSVGDPRVRQWRYDYNKLFRINHVSWWAEEMPNDIEMQYAAENLKAHGNRIDFIITHCPPTCILRQMGYQPDKLSNFLQNIRDNTQYRRWFCGHIHMDRAFTHDNIDVLYESIRQID